MTEADSDLLEIFRDEANGRLDDMEAALLAVEAGDAGADIIDEVFRDAHTIKGTAGMIGLDDVRALAHAVEDVLSNVRDTGSFPSGLAGTLLRSTGALRTLVNGGSEPVSELVNELAPVPAPRHAGEPRRAAASQPPADADEQTDIPAQPSPEASAAPVQARPRAERRPLRVPAEKIDHLLDVVGEVMQDRRRLAHSMGEDTGLSQEVAEVLSTGDRMLDELKDAAVGMRTLQLSVLVAPLRRAVRDLAKAAGKQVDFVVMGAETELDRVILESLAEPLTHVLRNTINHGIEPPRERARVGKPPRGRIELRAVPRGGLVEITVSDDGKGVSAEVIQEAGRVGSLVDVVAQPGYSTATDVTSLAGRGVGLDAVKAYVQSVGGGLEIRSEPGRGFDVVMLLPLAFALMEVLLFERGGAVYGVPLAVVDEVVVVDATFTLEGRQSLEVHGRAVPVADVAVLVGAQAPPQAPRPPALVVSAASRRVVASCDRLLGKEEVVVKPLGPVIAGGEGYFGAAILGDGRIALLIDPATLTTGRRHAVLPAAPPPPAAKKILVVEDSFTVRELQRSILETAGYSVITARDGREGLDVVERDDEIALVVSDVEMPRVDGLALTRAIRSNPARSSLPVVIVTAHASDDERRQGIEAGADAYMAKRSFDQQALLSTVERLVGR
jgi:two-component system, chemotaxis family, sensor kinase CheA